MVIPYTWSLKTLANRSVGQPGAEKTIVPYGLLRNRNRRDGAVPPCRESWRNVAVKAVIVEKSKKVRHNRYEVCLRDDRGRMRISPCATWWYDIWLDTSVSVLPPASNTSNGVSS